MVPVLPDSYGYFIVLGIGASMALVFTFLIKAELRWLGARYVPGSRAAIAKILQDAAIPLVMVGIIATAAIMSSYLLEAEETRKATLLSLIQDEKDEGALGPDVVSLIEQRGSYTLNFTLIILALVAAFSIVVVLLNSKLRRLVRLQTEELIKANDDLVSKDKLRDEFLKIASHEMRTPIQPILGYTELYMKGLVKPEKALSEIYREAKRLRQLTSDILDVSKIDSNNIEYRLERLDVAELISTIVENMKLQATPDVSLHTKFDPRISHVTADRERLAQVFTNILGNALKFTLAGKIEVETFYVSTTDSLRIEFRDSGPGIPSIIVPRLFEKFATVDVEGRNRNGTGLGLYLCKKIVEQHGGIIEAQNKPNGCGAMFVVLLPINLKPSGRQMQQQAKVSGESQEAA